MPAILKIWNPHPLRIPSLTIRSLTTQYYPQGWQTISKTMRLTAKLSCGNLKAWKFPGVDTSTRKARKFHFLCMLLFSCGVIKNGAISNSKIWYWNAHGNKTVSRKCNFFNMLLYSNENNSKFQLHRIFSFSVIFGIEDRVSKMWHQKSDMKFWMSTDLLNEQRYSNEIDMSG